ncbi:MAG: hypothetical protein AAF368_06765 [Planctomycetota bacterium]
MVTHEPDVGERAENILRMQDGRVLAVTTGAGEPLGQTPSGGLA